MNSKVNEEGGKKKKELKPSIAYTVYGNVYVNRPQQTVTATMGSRSFKELLTI